MTDHWKRSRQMAIYGTKSELERWTSAAEKAGMKRSDWARLSLNQAADATAPSPDTDSPPQ